jgi:O-antigen/teichoic acid export membrane protein
MKPMSLVLAFLPLVGFSILARWLPHGDIGIAGLVAAVLALTAMLFSRPVWPPRIISSCSLILFAVIAALGFTLGKHDDRWLSTWGGGGVALILGLIILILVPVIPFTEQFARESVPRSQWKSPAFRKINRVLSAAWGLAIVGLGASRILAAVVSEHTSRRLPELLLGLLVPLAILIYMFRFSGSYPERVRHQQPADDHSGTA